MWTDTHLFCFLGLRRYISPASAMCYWRKALWGFHKAQQYEVDLSGAETSYESFMLKGMKGPGGSPHR